MGKLLTQVNAANVKVLDPSSRFQALATEVQGHQQALSASGAKARASSESLGKEATAKSQGFEAQAKSSAESSQGQLTALQQQVTQRCDADKQSFDAKLKNRKGSKAETEARRAQGYALIEQTRTQLTQDLQGVGSTLAAALAAVLVRLATSRDTATGKSTQLSALVDGAVNDPVRALTALHQEIVNAGKTTQQAHQTQQSALETQKKTLADQVKAAAATAAGIVDPVDTQVAPTLTTGKTQASGTLETLGKTVGGQVATVTAQLVAVEQLIDQVQKRIEAAITQVSTTIDGLVTGTLTAVETLKAPLKQTLDAAFTTLDTLVASSARSSSR